MNTFKMKPILFCLAFLFTPLLVGANKKVGGITFEKAFLTPPESSKPWVYWYWINNNISKEGITKDLEAMAKVGIGEALIGNVVDPSLKMGNVKVLSEEWWGCMVHAISEAERLSIKVGMFNCPGWSQSGGPWVKPEQAMRYLATSETTVSGPGKVTVKLKQPANPFQPVITQAFPTIRNDKQVVSAIPHRIIASENIKNDAALFDGDTATVAFVEKFPAMVTVCFDSLVTMRSLELIPAVAPVDAECQMQVKEESGVWRTVATRRLDRGNLMTAVGPMTFGPACESFDAVTAREFRLIFTGIGMGYLSEIKLSGSLRLSHYVEKQLGKMSPIPQIKHDTYLWKPSAACNPDASLVVTSAEVIDISSYVDKKGNLTWDAPEGEWTIIHTGMALTGTKNTPTSPEAEGYEIDKMSRKAANEHFEAFVGEILRRIPAEKRKGFRHVVADSYEQGPENWTEGFAEEFIRVYGYSPYPWFPVLTGRIVESADLSDRFLWDMRRLIADKISTDYVGVLRENCEKQGLRLWLENYGHWGFSGEFLSYGGASDDIGGEFWLSDLSLGAVECRCASSAAHIYGKSVVSAEAFTSHWTYVTTPRDFKARGDWAFTEGINHFVLHVYIHQPDERKPGINAWFGTDFNRHSTWFYESETYFDYVRRCAGVLQTGRHVADVAYFIGEDAPKMTGSMIPSLPKGYDYDFINGEILMKSAKVENGRIVLASGASYRILVLPNQTTMRPEMLECIAGLVRQGATVLGPRPVSSPSARSYPFCDQRVHSLASGMWTSEPVSRYGKGTIYSKMDLKEAMYRLGVSPDVVASDSILYVHRRDSEADVYFLSNQYHGYRKEEIGFRVTGRQPELWNPVTGEMRDLPLYEAKGAFTYVTLEFDASDSWFIVFRKKVSKSVLCTNFPKTVSCQTLSGQWTVSLDSAYGTPSTIVFDSLIDLRYSNDPTVSYYSGKMKYDKNFLYDGNTSVPVFLDLGRVEALAQIEINGYRFPYLWRYPYQVEISKFLRKGMNRLSVEVVNTWWNRLVGDCQPGAQPYTWSTYVGWQADSKLLPAGLIGPVTLNVIRRDD